MSVKYLCVGGWVKGVGVVQPVYVPAGDVARYYAVLANECVMVDEGDSSKLAGVNVDSLLRLSPRADGDYNLARRMEERALKDALSKPQPLQLLPKVEYSLDYMSNLIDAAARVVTCVEFGVDSGTELYDASHRLLLKLLKKASSGEAVQPAGTEGCESVMADEGKVKLILQAFASGGIDGNRAEEKISLLLDEVYKKGHASGKRQIASSGQPNLTSVEAVEETLESRNHHTAWGDKELVRRLALLVDAGKIAGPIERTAQETKTWNERVDAAVHDVRTIIGRAGDLRSCIDTLLRQVHCDAFNAGVAHVESQFTGVSLQEWLTQACELTGTYSQERKRKLERVLFSVWNGGFKAGEDRPRPLVEIVKCVPDESGRPDFSHHLNVLIPEIERQSRTSLGPTEEYWLRERVYNIFCQVWQQAVESVPVANVMADGNFDLGGMVERLLTALYGKGVVQLDSPKRKWVHEALTEASRAGKGAEESLEGAVTLTEELLVDLTMVKVLACFPQTAYDVVKQLKPIVAEMVRRSRECQ